jgi:sugar phosphate isomerase/epimerase
MKYIFFSKMVKEQSIPQLIATLKRIGADGVDLAVRPGYPVNPGNVKRALPEAVKQFKDAGLAVPLVSASTDFVDPKSAFAEDLWSACHNENVPNIKIGYWSYNGKDYWKKMDEARRSLEVFQTLAMRFGVKACLHTHSGNYLGLNASSTMQMARGFNPFAIGIYLDPGHLNVNGEPLTMAFDMAGEFLCLVAVKDSFTQKGEGGQVRVAKFVPLGQGTVDWREMMRVLVARSYDGPISFHSEYDGWPQEQIIAQTQKDIIYLREIEKQVRLKA